MPVTRSEPDADVIIVGAGPVGLVTACLLADLDVDVLVIEADDACADEPRAISLVAESMRTLDAIGILDDIRSDIVWNTGTAYYGANGKALVVVRPAVQTLGYPQKSFFDQPGLLHALQDGIAARKRIRIRFDAAFVSSSSDADGVTTTISSRESGEQTLRARYLIGCDGARSAVRRSAGIAMTGSSQTEPWIVLDLINDARRERTASFYCTPDRPAVVVPGAHGRCRYELMLLPGESAEEMLRDEAIARILRPYRSIKPEDVRRRAVYVSHQLVAERWRDGRLLLAGDAAHLMPPFAGQGFNTGMRDARNLAWKLAAVLHGEATEALLDTYQDERRQHARMMVELSHRMGTLIMTTDRRRARLRDLAFRSTWIVPPVKRYLATMKWVKPARLERGFVAATPGAGPLVGDYLPQPEVSDHRGRIFGLDRALGRGWSLVRVGPAPPHEPDLSGLDALHPTRCAVLPPHRIAQDAVVEPEFCDQRGQLPQPETTRYLLVRPDRVVAADFDASQTAAVAHALSHVIALPRIPSRPTGDN